MAECVFCGIVKKEIPSKIIYEDDLVLAFRDLEPQAPVHVLIVPKKHLTNITEADENIGGHMLKVAAYLAKKLGLEKSGFRLVNNNGKDGGQTVNHLHFHLLGGRSMTWPPG